MTEEHPNITLMKRLDIRDIASAGELIAEDAVWHYFNPNLPELEGDYTGLAGIAAFFEAVGQKSRGTFRVEPQSVTPVGDELVVVHARDTLTFDGTSIALDVVVVWRIVDGMVREVWDIVPGQVEQVESAE